MIDAERFRAIITGRERGPIALALRGALRLASIGYSAAMHLRNWRYDHGRARVEHVQAPVVCVGNLTLGGTGKTPMVAWIARHLREHRLRVTIVSRGYGAEAGARNDEALELEQRLPDVPHVQNVDRAAAARMAIEEFEAQVIVLDDGFQHRRLARDLDIVLLDAADPWGCDYVFPRGMLRESLVGLRRADAVVLSRADMIDAQAREAIRARAQRLAPDAVWAEVVHAPQHWLAADGRTLPLDALAGKSVAAFCGIGNPAGFRHTLERCGCELAELRAFPDHHAYTREDVEELAHTAAEINPAACVCTHKDLVKIGIDTLGGAPLWALVVGIEFLTGQHELEELLATITPPLAV